MRDLLTTLLRGRKVLLGRDFYQFRQVGHKRMTLGNRFADWTFCPDLLDETSIVYSFGVGEDISFDLLLIERFKLQVHAFDPSPSSVTWIAKQDLPEGFHFYPYGLAATDGNIVFAEPADPGIQSLFAAHSLKEVSAGLVEHALPVHRLPTIVAELGHNRIDLLKMDIEGAEYEVIEDLIHSPVPIRQLLIEFHHRFPYLGVRKSKEAISLLNRTGFKIFHVSPSGEEISFIKTSD